MDVTDGQKICADYTVPRRQYTDTSGDLPRQRFMVTRTLIFSVSLLFVLSGGTTPTRAADFEDFLQPLLARHCTKCHGGKEINAEVNFKNIASSAHLLDKPELIQRIIEAIDSRE